MAKVKTSGKGEEKAYKCIKCKKTKPKSQGMFVLGGSTYCCNQCCGDVAKGDHKKKQDNFCEFCAR